MTLAQLAEFSALGTTGYSTGNLALLANTIYELDAASEFLAMLSGFNNYDSYLSIAGTSYSAGASPPADPVPAPGAAALVLIGLAGLRLLRRR